MWYLLVSSKYNISLISANARHCEKTALTTLNDMLIGYNKGKKPSSLRLAMNPVPMLVSPSGMLHSMRIVPYVISSAKESSRRGWVVDDTVMLSSKLFQYINNLFLQVKNDDNENVTTSLDISVTMTRLCKQIEF